METIPDSVYDGVGRAIEAFEENNKFSWLYDSNGEIDGREIERASTNNTVKVETLYAQRIINFWENFGRGAAKEKNKKTVDALRECTDDAGMIINQDGENWFDLAGMGFSHLILPQSIKRELDREDQTEMLEDYLNFITIRDDQILEDDKALAVKENSLSANQGSSGYFFEKIATESEKELNDKDAPIFFTLDRNWEATVVISAVCTFSPPTIIAPHTDIGGDSVEMIEIKT